MEIYLLKKFLGNPKKVNYNSTKATFNCPKCKEENGFKFDGKYNLEVNLDNNKKKYKFKKICHCWSCGFSGPIQYLLKSYAPTHVYDEFLSYGEANPYVSGYVGEEDGWLVKKEEVVPLPDEFISFENANFGRNQVIEAYNYLIHDRKLSPEQIKYYKIGFCPYGKFGKKIVIPSYNLNNKVNYFLTRSYEKYPKEKYKNCDADKTKIIFNEKQINWNETVYLTEGMFDLFALPINTVPLLGKELNSDFLIFKKLITYKPNIVICLDEDAQKRSKEMMKVLISYGLNVRILKISNKDLAKNFEDNGKKSIFTLLKETK